VNPTIISQKARFLMTEPQMHVIESYPRYPVDLTGLSYDVMSGDVTVRFGEDVGFQVTPAGKIKSIDGGTVHAQVLTMQVQIADLQRTIDSLCLTVYQALHIDEQVSRPAPRPVLSME